MMVAKRGFVDGTAFKEYQLQKERVHDDTVRASKHAWGWVISCWFLVVGSWLLAIDRRPSAIGHRPSTIDRKP